MDSIQSGKSLPNQYPSSTRSPLPASNHAIDQFNAALQSPQTDSSFPIINEKQAINDVLIANPHRQESSWVANGAAADAARAASLAHPITSSPLSTEPCPVPPAAPPTFNVDDNIAAARANFGNIAWFYDQVKNKGNWDYKQAGAEYETLGNFNFGVAGRAIGFPDSVLLRGAGWAQQQAGTSNPQFGNWYDWSSSYGDDPKDQQAIQQGIDYYNRGCEK